MDFVVDKDGKTAERRSIQLGHRSNRLVEIISELEIGEKILISNYTAFLNVRRIQINRSSSKQKNSISNYSCERQSC